MNGWSGMDENYFCMAPFIHVQINATGDINPCCRFESPTIYDKEYDGLQDAFESEENQRLRKSMLAGEYIENCKTCYKDDEIGIVSPRKEFNEKYYSTDDIENPKLKYLEIALSNRCNFKCVTCSSRFSSAWEEEDKFLERKVFLPNVNDVRFEDMDLSHVEEIKFLGGEPLLDEEYLSMFKRLNHEKVKIHLVTNNSIRPKEEWLFHIDKFKETLIHISIDGIEDVAECVRYGTKWKRFEKNFIHWLNFKNDRDKIQITPYFVGHSMNALNMHDTITWVKNTYNQYTEKGFKESNLLPFAYDFLKYPEYLNMSYLPDTTKQLILDHNGKYLRKELKEFLNLNSYDKNISKSFVKYCNFLSIRDDLPPMVLKVLNSVKNA